MIRQIYHKPRIDWILLFMLACLVVILASCNVTKAKRSSSSDSLNVSRGSLSVIDTSRSGALSKSTTDTKEANEWWRTITTYPRDTTVINLSPMTVIHEGGKGTREVQEAHIDSSWQQAALSILQAQSDSMRVWRTEIRKDKESRPNVLMWILIALGGYWLVTQAIPWFVKRVKFIKQI